MVADLREMQENQWVSKIRIDKLEFINEQWIQSFDLDTGCYGLFPDRFL